MTDLLLMEPPYADYVNYSRLPGDEATFDPLWNMTLSLANVSLPDNRSRNST